MNSHSKQLQEKLWAAAEQLRANGSLKLNEISEPILGLIFLKFADVRFKRAQSTMVSEKKVTYSTRVRQLTPDHYKSIGIIYLPENATYSYLSSLPENENIGKAINGAMKAIESANTDLAGVLPQDYTSLSKKADENNRILITLLKNFNQIPDDIEGDAFGEIYEYFLGEFARAEGAKGGEFFTPQSIVRLLVEIIEPYHGKIYDPACGSGGMFVQSAHFVETHAKNKSKIMNEVALYGQEKGSNNIRIAKMNLAIHGLSGKIAEANSYYEDLHNSVGKFDFVLANPPFNVKGKDKNKQLVIDPARLQGDPRYYLGLPITGKKEISNANYLWMQIFASSLNPKGRAGFVMANSASDAGNAEKEIRKKMIDSGLVDVVVAVGTNMFLNAPLSCALWFYDKDKAGTDRKNKILFINAQDIFIEIDRAHNTWTDDQIFYISSIVRLYRGENTSDVLETLNQNKQLYEEDIKDLNKQLVEAGAEESKTIQDELEFTKRTLEINKNIQFIWKKDFNKKYTDVKGRCNAATISKICDNEYSLNPGRYVEIVEKEMSDVDFDARMKDLVGEFTSLTDDAHNLEKKIKDDWENIL